MRFSSSVRSWLAPGAVALLLVGCGSSQSDADATAAPPAEAATQPASTPASDAATAAAELPVVYVYKTPTCGCCGDWVTHIEQAGFRAEVQDLPNLAAVKQRTGVPQHLESCHTSLVEGYVIEGHVPASSILRLLAEKPAVAGIAVPGMPMGSPGMEGPWKDAYDVIAFTRDGRGTIYESH